MTAPPAETATPAPPVPDSPGIGTEHPSSSSQPGEDPESEGGSSENPDPESDVPSQGGDGEGGSSDQPPKKGAYDPDDGVLQVWTLGDSITLGVQGGYRNDIYNLLTADGQNVDMVGTEYDDSTEIADKDHEGHVAFTIQQTIESVDGWLAQITPPDIVLLWLGANDFAWWTNMTPAQHADDFDRLVNHLLVILPAQSKVVIGTIPPESSEIVESVALDRADMADDFNEMLRESRARVRDVRRSRVPRGRARDPDARRSLRRHPPDARGTRAHRRRLPRRALEEPRALTARALLLSRNHILFGSPCRSSIPKASSIARSVVQVPIAAASPTAGLALAPRCLRRSDARRSEPG